MKDLVAAARVPTARHGTFTAVAPALEFLRSLPSPWVVKTDGLAAGKADIYTRPQGLDMVLGHLEGLAGA